MTGRTDLGKFVDLALSCVGREAPHGIVLRAVGEESRTAKELTPIFYGCYDWHSAVHAHWLLARTVRARPGAPFEAAAREALESRITDDAVAAEARYLSDPARAGFEVPYGLAWLLTLAREIRDDAGLKRASVAMEPIAAIARDRIATWLRGLAVPVRSGVHDQTAFSLGLVLDASRGVDGALEALAAEKARAFFAPDTGGPLHEEPRGWDFLSPCLAEADVVRRILSPADFAAWLDRFVVVTPDVVVPATHHDSKNYKESHLDGLNLSRAWMLAAIADALPDGDGRVPVLRALSDAHAKAGVAAVTAEHYSGAHWLGTYAVYFLTRR